METISAGAAGTQTKEIRTRHRRKGLLYDLRKNRIMWLMVFPVLVYFLINSYLPMVGVYFAFTKFDFNSGLFGSPFVGFENFRMLIKLGALEKITINTVAYNLVFIGLGNAFAVTAAILLNEIAGKFFKRITQTVMFLPYFVSFVLLGSMAYSFFNYDSGFVNTVLQWFGMERQDIYNTPAYWPFIITFFYIWKNLGYSTIIYLATVVNINQDYYEAAELDGASAWQKIWSITLPLLKPTFIILLLFAVGHIMKGQFDLFYQLVGANGMLFNATDIIDTYVYRSLKVTFDMGLANAAGLYQSFFGFVLIMIVNFIIKKINRDYALF
ncbi:ABC transporter permease [Cohnella hashimotonis]|uniref:ABC transporter permease subunit n=1 Tax=Cohnella hashimotonis TaxID=2826895 RepID=A0ABT6TEP1_9BACL|nr:ABC transporter permease subunit [Cohnella hashimotonis]MDI4645155.1 ABC transporter permease subunit [Cohnella hashimotonis]